MGGQGASETGVFAGWVPGEGGKFEVASRVSSFPECNAFGIGVAGGVPAGGVFVTLGVKSRHEEASFLGEGVGALMLRVSFVSLAAAGFAGESLARCVGSAASDDPAGVRVSLVCFSWLGLFLVGAGGR